MVTSQHQPQVTLSRTFHGVTYRHIAPTDDAALTLTSDLLRRFADESGVGHRFDADEDTLRAMMVDARCALEVIWIVSDPATEEPRGLLLTTRRWATFTGQPVLYLNDIWIQPECRGQGMGAKAMAYLQLLAEQRDCVRVEWDCHIENVWAERFYERLGAQPDHQWRTWRLL